MDSYFIRNTQIALIDAIVYRIDEDDNDLGEYIGRHCYNALITFDKDTGYSSALDPNSPYEPWTTFDDQEHDKFENIYDAIKYFVEWAAKDGIGIPYLMVRIIFEDGFDTALDGENVDIYSFIEDLKGTECYRE